MIECPLKLALEVVYHNNSDRALFELATKVFIVVSVKPGFSTDQCSEHLPISHTDQQPCNKLLCKHKEIITIVLVVSFVSKLVNLSISK